jgi:hypothetical protein
MQWLTKSRNLLLPFLFFLVSTALFAQIAVSIRIGPPVLPVYDQPLCPGDGYIWTPGYWAYGPTGYYWVPGAWVMPPHAGMLWTPGYWGFERGFYRWHVGYWGPHVGFYGGINYGFGYFGVGFVGGRWNGGRFVYNTAVTNVNTRIVRNVYVDRTVIHTTTNHASFNGRGGITARPNRVEQTVMREQHFQPTFNQRSHEQFAGRDRKQLAPVNHGRPGTARTAKEGTLTPRDRQQVNRQQNNMSGSVHNNKHNAATEQYGNNRVGARDPQQQRMVNGNRGRQMHNEKAPRR